jgi:hypothetical protein
VILSQITWELRDPETRFAVLLDLADTFSQAPRRSWGYRAEEIELGRRLMPVVSKGAAGRSLPSALTRWYATVGRLPELTSTQNRLRGPDDLEFEEGLVVIYTECQHCTVWGFPLEALNQDDPPVVYADRGNWRHEADSVSSFALTVGITELCLHGGRFKCSGDMDTTAKAALRSALRLVPVAPLRWPAPERDAFFLVDDRVVVLVEDEFLFAAGLDDEVDEYLDELAAPGRIRWVLYEGPSGVRRVRKN